MGIELFLHGGTSNRESEKNKKFFTEIIDSVPKQDVKILCFYFARPFHRWEESFYEDRDIFESVDSRKELKIEKAKIDKFESQIESSDLIFINGGMKGCLKEELLKLGDLKVMFRDKVVVGISAGANMMSKYYYSSMAGGIREGISLLPIKLFTHYDDDNEEELIILEKYKKALKAYKIWEEEYIKFELE
jgi:peptidase E